MRQFGSDIRHPGKFSMLSKSIASSALLGLLCTLTATVSAESSTPPVFAQARPAAQTNNVNNRLIGLWQTRASNSGAMVKFIFAPTGKMFIVFPATSGPSPALELAYRINSAARPMQLDMITGANNQAAQTIFEFTGDGKLRLQLQGTRPGQPRPSAFSTGATVFEKVSNATTLPADAQIVSPSQAPNLTPPNRRQ